MTINKNQQGIMKQTEPVPENLASDNTSRAANQRKRRRGLGLLVIGVLVGGVGYTVWQNGHGASEETDNAYVQGPIVQVTPQLPGTVVK